MRCLTISLVALVMATAAPARPQEPVPAEPAAPTAPAEDTIGRQAAQLEAELGKLQDSAAEAGELMLELVDLYHGDGRVLGLVRIGERLINAHPRHERHKDAMLKLIDGLQALSRNQAIVGYCRQFIARYPDEAACARLELLAADTLFQMNDLPQAAAAYEAVWRRQPTTPAGREAGVRAVGLYGSISSVDSYTAAATLAEAMLDTYPAGEFLTHMGWQAVTNWGRAGKYARSNTAAGKMLQLGLPMERELLKQLHVTMGQNYSNLGQRTNAVESYQKARALGDHFDLFSRVITETYQSGAKAAALEPLVVEYFQKYADRADRFLLRGYLAQAYLRDGDKARALAIIAELLPHDAVALSQASVYVQQNGNEPQQLTASEQVLLNALQANTRDAYYLRWVLGLELYRDRLKDLAKARQVVRELVTRSPTNDSYTQQAMHWLLSTATNDAEFQADVTELIKVRTTWFHWTNHRQYLSQWAKQAVEYKNDADAALAAQTNARGQWLQARLDEADQQPFIKDWLAGESDNRPIAEAARTRLLAADNQANLTDEAARALFNAQAYSMVNYGTAEERSRAAGVYAAMCRRFPKDFAAAAGWLSSAYSYNPPEVAKEAALHFMSLAPVNDGNQYLQTYQMMVTADRLQDAELARQVLVWTTQVHEQFGWTNLTYADTVGDILEKYDLKQEALAFWRRALATDPNNYYARSCGGRLAIRMEPADRLKFLQEQVALNADYRGAYSLMLADEYLKAGNLDRFEKVLRDSLARQADRPYRTWGFEESPPSVWLDQFRNNKEAPIADKRRVFTMVRDLKVDRPSAAAQLALLELPPEQPLTPIERLLAFQAASTMLGNESYHWDSLIGYAQAAMGRREYMDVASLVSGMLVNLTNVEPTRLQAGRDMVAQCYARMGAVGLSIDDASPIAPLLQAALYLRLGDERLALAAYNANRALFDAHRDELPVDLILFVCEGHLVAGGEPNYERVEDILRNWLIKFSEAPDLDASTKARVQLLLARNYSKAQRYDVARTEYTSIINRYADTPEAIEAEFGIGESFMAQKVYDQAEAVFEKLAGNKNRDVVIRAEFLRGVMANRRGDLDEARDIFRGVLDMVPSVELANQALFNLSEVYGAEQRYMDQLELLRTVGRLGRSSKRWHTPGVDLSIVVQDSDLGTSRGDGRVPVRVTTAPGGDEETIYLYSGGGGKGLFRADLQTRLGEVVKDNKVLELSGQDTIYCDYPESFKSDFRSVPLSDAEIKIAANGKLEVASAKIIDQEKETFSQRLEREAREERERDLRISQARPANQIKPGNPIYLRVQDADRDLTGDPDKIVVKLQATSGDQVQVMLSETGPHSGLFEGLAATGELPAGALASDTAIDHSPLMAIDSDRETYWISEPDGATPKFLSIDMKDLRPVDHVTISSPDGERQAPVRGVLEGSHDGRFWYRLASIPPQLPLEPVGAESEEMTERVYSGYYLNLTTWQQVVDLSKNATPVEQAPESQLAWKREADAADANQPYAVLWHGKFVQPKSGAVRFGVQAARSALVVDNQMELPLGDGARTADVWLEQGTHDLTIFAAVGAASQGVLATRAREDNNVEQLSMGAFRTADFDLSEADLGPALPRMPAEVKTDNGVWDFQFDEMELRHVRLMIDEYVGEAVAVSHVEIRNDEADEIYIPTEADVLSLSDNDTLEIAAGDLVTATYTDELTQTAAGRSQLLTGTLQATYYNARISPIAYDFVRQPGGAIDEIRKQLIRVDPGERFIVEIIDYDLDATNEPDQVEFQVAVNDGEPIKLIAQETLPHSGIFTKEVDTSDAPAEGKLAIKPGDRVYCAYVDAQNTFPGHALLRETVVYANQPSQGRLRVVETRIVPPPAGSDRSVRPQVIYLPSAKKRGKKNVAHVAFEAPLTVEVFDRDAAKDSRSTVVVELETTAGAKLEVECAVSHDFSEYSGAEGLTWALEEGRFIGQVIMQLGSTNSQDVIPLSAEMPRDLIGRARIDGQTDNQALVTRVLNLTGKDLVKAVYGDELRPGDSAAKLSASGRLIANGTLRCVDRDYEHDVTQLHVGEKLFLVVVDADRDLSDQRDTAAVEITTERGDRETVLLAETLAHSGEFTASVTLRAADSPTAGNMAPDDPAVESYFGDTVRLRYLDPAASTETGELTVELELPVVVGTDGLVAAFSKVFGDENLAVETQFHIAESYFELFKSHKKLQRQDDLRLDLEAGRRVLREVMEDYPDPKYVPRTAYLLGQFAQELSQWNEAIEAYKMIVRQYGDHSLAVDAQYKMAQCYEEAGDFDEALEAYVTLAATYPKSPLIANVMIRIGERFYKEQNYPVAAQVCEKFLERFDSHEWAPKIAFRIGQCFYKDKQYQPAADAFDRFAKIFPDDELAADALFWSGESFRMANNNPLAFRRYNRCRWDFPASDAAKYARGRLALPAMLQQFEAEANVEDE